MRVPIAVAAVTSVAMLATPSVAVAESDSHKPREGILRDAGAGFAGSLVRDAEQASSDLADAIRNMETGGHTGDRTMTSRAATAQTAQSAGPATTPTFTSPYEGATVGGVVTVTVTSTAPSVRFTMPSVAYSEETPVTDGTATVHVPTWGTTGSQTITAADCDDAGACGSVVTRSVVVANAAPVITSPADGTVVGTSFTSTVTAEGGGVRWLVDGSPIGWDDVAPYQQTLYTDGLSQGNHVLTAVVCNVAGTICAQGNPSTPIGLSVESRLNPIISSISPGLFSPGTDGRRDTSTVTYQLDTTQTVTWRVSNASGSTVVPSRSLGTRNKGTYSFTFDGKRPDGRYLPSGGYTVHVETTKTLSGSMVYGHAMAAVTIDRTKPRVSSVSAAPVTVFPVRDGYKDATRLQGRLAERVSSAYVQVFTRAGRRVRTLRLGSRPVGLIAATWNGRRANGRLVPEGSYRFRFVTQDPAGNRVVGAKYAVAVSHKQLVRKTGSKTVTAYGSVTAAYEGTCSSLVSPGVRGWANSVGYYSDLYDCSYYEGDDVAATDHAVTLPRAVKYGAIRVNAYGGRALDDYADVAALIYYDGKGNLTDTGRVLEPSIKTYVGPAVGSRYVNRNRRVRWLVGTVDYNWYDIKKFTVRYAYFVLR